MEKVKIIAGNLRYERLLKNYSQEYMASCMKISQNAYSKLELGYSKLTIERAFFIARTLEIDVTRIFQQEPQQQALSA